MTITNDLQKDAAEKFARDIADHKMTVLLDDGLYRHLKFSVPNKWGDWFELVTWPGRLAIYGVMGGHMFSRTTDMFEFFRHNGHEHGINPGYWAEKLPDCGKSVRKYSEDVLRAELAEHIAEYEKDYPDRLARYRVAKVAFDARPLAQRWSFDEPVKPKSPDEVRELMDDYDADGLLAHDAGARQLLAELERAGVVSDTWEWDLTDWTYQYLWCCHAIRWGIEQYDNRATGTCECGDKTCGFHTVAVCGSGVSGDACTNAWQPNEHPDWTWNADRDAKVCDPCHNAVAVTA